MTTEVVIESRYTGPPDSANGGYACGVLAGALQANGELKQQTASHEQPG